LPKKQLQVCSPFDIPHLIDFKIKTLEGGDFKDKKATDGALLKENGVTDNLKQHHNIFL
jgi:hypothetical protein